MGGQPADIQKRIDALEAELRESLENVMVGAVEKGAQFQSAWEFLRSQVARLNGLPHDERCQVAAALIAESSDEQIVAMAALEVRDARFSLVVNDSEPSLALSVRLWRPIEQVRISFTMADQESPLCSTCGLLQADPEANHMPDRGVRLPDGSATGPLLAGFGHVSVCENGYYPHVFRARQVSGD